MTGLRKLLNKMLPTGFIDAGTSAKGSKQELTGWMMLIICLFFITSSDSVAYVMATLLLKEKYISLQDKIF